MDASIIAALILFCGGIIAAAVGAYVAHRLHQSVATPEGVPEIGELVPQIARDVSAMAAWAVEHDARDARGWAHLGVPEHVLAGPPPES